MDHQAVVSCSAQPGCGWINELSLFLTSTAIGICQTWLYLLTVHYICISYGRLYPAEIIDVLKRNFLHMACMGMLTWSCYAQDTPLSTSGKAFCLMFRDTIPMEVELVFDTDGLPDFYHCHVNTPVCDDGLCRSLLLDVYWDLLGNFTRFEVPEFPPLTKWDHLEFTTEDYVKLNEILRDKNSVLGTVRDVNALFDLSTKKISEKVDAVTGATRETIKNAVVPGAVYSSYTLWHVVNGDIPSGIQQYTVSYQGPALINKFLLSENYHYHYEALDYLVSTGYEGHLPELVRMLNNSGPFVTRMAVKQFPRAWLDEEQFQSAVTALMDRFDYRAQVIWLDRMLDVQVQGTTLDLLTGNTDRFSQYQLQQVLKLCDLNRSRLSNASVTQIGSLLQHESVIIAQGTYQILEKLASEDKNARKILRHYEKSQDI